MKLINEQQLAKELSGEIKKSFPNAKRILISFNRFHKGKVITKIKVQIKRKIFHVEGVAYDLLDSLWEAKEVLDHEFNSYGRKKAYIQLQ